MDDILSQFGGMPGRGDNHTLSVKLSYEEILKGVTKSITVKKYMECSSCNGNGAKDQESIETCFTCKGKGKVGKIIKTYFGDMRTETTCEQCDGYGLIISVKCSECDGEGRVEGEETFSIDIPAGVQNGLQLTIAGKGNAGKRNGKKGNVNIVIDEEEHPLFVRDGLNVGCIYVIQSSDAVFGITVQIPTLEGKAQIDIPPGTPDRKVFRLKGKGFPEVNGEKKGDQLVQIIFEKEITIL